MTGVFHKDFAFAQAMDRQDPPAHWRDQFYIPKNAAGEDSIYLCGNSLGLQPKSVSASVLQELEDWKNLGVEGHLHAKNPWLPYHEFLTAQLASLVGAKSTEVVAMNSLTVNLHLMMVTFYRPTKTRYKILIEGNAFGSDRYAVMSQLQFHGCDKHGLIELQPRSGEYNLRMEDVVKVLQEQGESIALVLLGGVNYYTGQLLPMQRITQEAHKQNCFVGFDLAHAVGNIPLQLHDWNVDFACWCSYKYLNAGPGSVAGCFVHERFAQQNHLPRFCGWWGHDKENRFKMQPDFKAIPGAEGWQLSNPPILSLAAVKAALNIFKEVGMEALRKKSLLLTGYLEFLLDDLAQPLEFHIITPRSEAERGCQLSLASRDLARGFAIFQMLTRHNVICDWREPDCIRVAPVPLYNSFQDVYKFAQILIRSSGK